MTTEITDVRDGREFAILVRSRPPRVVGGTLLLLAGLLVAAVVWSCLTEADLVVRAGGRVRPITPPVPIRVVSRGARAGTACLRVVRVNHRLGDLVHKGDELLRLDTEQLENEIASRRRTIQSDEEELASLESQRALLVRQQRATRSRLEAEHRLAEADFLRATEERRSDLRIAQAELELAANDLERHERLALAMAASAADLERSRATHAAAAAKLERTRLPVDGGRAAIAAESLTEFERESEAKLEEWDLRRKLAEGTIGAARMELRNLELDLAQASVPAPIDGIVSAGEVRVGDILDPARPVLEISERGRYCFEASVPSSEMGPIRPGMSARIRLDAYDHHRYGSVTGIVRHVAPDSAPADAARAFAYTVRIELEQAELSRGDLRAPVKLGLSGQVDIVTERRYLLAVFLNKIHRTISLD
ncbi:MAG: HlyD family efflux transporter periplasmic adaptor subunit [Planctomycetes bacterium]|nr:HlyD family efflux transporter periplasmic adaptor subunit [Planctomycetota bacterium]